MAKRLVLFVMLLLSLGSITTVSIPNSIYGAILSSSAAAHFTKAFKGPTFDAHEFKRGVEVVRVMHWQLTHRERMDVTVGELVDIGKQFGEAFDIPPVKEWGKFGDAIEKAKTRLQQLVTRVDRFKEIPVVDGSVITPDMFADARLLSKELAILRQDFLTPVADTEMPTRRERLRKELHKRSPRWGSAQTWRVAKEIAHVGLDLVGKITGREQIPAVFSSIINAFDPVLLHNGEFYHRVEDVRLPARGLSLRVERVYRSRHDFSGPMGRNWTHNYYERLLTADDGRGNVVWMDAQGRKFVFQKQTSGWRSPRGVFSKLVVHDGTYMLEHPHGNTTTFHADGRLLSHADRVGHRVTCEYDHYRYLTGVVDAAGRRLVFTNDATGRVTRIADWKRRVWQYTYNQVGDLVAVTTPFTKRFPKGTTTRYEYSADATEPALNHNLTAIIDPKGQRYLENRYGTHGIARDRVVAQWYGDAPRPIRATYQLRRVGWGQGPNVAVDEVTVSDRLGIVRRYQHNRFGELLHEQIVNRHGVRHRIADYAYDDHGRRIRVVGPDGSAIISTYTGNDVERVHVGRNGGRRPIRAKENDTAKRVQRQLVEKQGPMPDDGVARHFYDANGNIERHEVVDEDGEVFATEYAYDMLDHVIRRRAQIADDVWAETSYIYDANENLREIIRPEGNRTIFRYDIWNRPVVVTKGAGDPTAERWRVAYDAAGRVIARTNPRGHTTRATYDEFGGLVSLTLPNGTVRPVERTQVAQAARQPRERRAPARLVRDAEGREVQFAYDGLHRMTTRIESAEANPYNPDGLIATHYAWDRNGRLIQLTDDNGNRTSYQYDAADRLIRERFADGSTIERAYYADGLLRRLRDQNGSDIELRYDVMGQPTRIASRTYQYDEHGRLVVAKTPSQMARFVYDAQSRVIKESINGLSVTHVYDVDHRLTQRRLADGSVEQRRYDALGRLIRLEQGDQRIDFTHHGWRARVATTYAHGGRGERRYDASGRVLREAYIAPNGESWQASYRYDRSGLLIESYDDDHRRTYQYDGARRLVQVSDGAHTTQWHLDGAGNWREVHRGGSKTTYDVDVMNAYRRITDHATGRSLLLQYDANGNLLDDGTRQYRYDLFNRLRTVADDTYDYDALSRRVLVNDMQHVYSGWHVVGAYRDRQLQQQFVRGDGVDDLLHVIQDRLGSVRLLLDAEGNIHKHLRYDPYGVPLDASTEVRYAFAGRPMQPTVGLQYFRYRTYAPMLGRFLTRDPLGYQTDLNAAHPEMNLYSYVRNNPLNNLDPSGLLTLHYWEPKLQLPRPTVGHMSITLDNGTYVSHWPTRGLKFPYLVEVPSARSSFAGDMASERFDPVELRLYGLDESAMQAWWASYSEGFSLWNNCSDVVAEALRQGGMTMPEHTISTPGQVLDDAWQQMPIRRKYKG